MGVILDKDGSITTEYHSGSDGSLIVHRSQDVNAIMAANKRERNDNSYRGRLLKPGQNFKKVASIPLVMCDDLFRDGSFWDKKEMKKILNDPDNRGIRTDGGRV